MGEIKHRYTRAILWSDVTGSVKDAVVAAVKAGADLTGAILARADLTGANLDGANLAGANLTDAYLARADLTDVNLAGANLAGANLTDAYLTRANLEGADLARANLSYAYLAGADLAGADLVRANLTGANLEGANLAGANLARANLACANLAYANFAGADLEGACLTGADITDAYLEGANHYVMTAAAPSIPYVRPATSVDRRAARLAHAARYRERHPEVPVVLDLDAKMLEAVQIPGHGLDMDDWHTCDTTHCRGGWAVHLAGQPGYELEASLGSTERAARAIYLASTGRVPHFYSTTEHALENIRRCATEDAEDAS
jgi:uncharacterized protein YjbI with pentapeptide repeats